MAMEQDGFCGGNGRFGRSGGTGGVDFAVFSVQMHLKS